MAVALGDVWALAWLAYPTTVFCLFTFLSVLQWFQPRRPGPGIRRSRRVSIIIVLGQVAVLSLVHAIVTSRIPVDPGISTAVKDIVVGQIACALVFGVQLSQCLDAQTQSFSPLLGSSLLSIFWESFLGCWAVGTRPVSHPMLPGDIANITLASIKSLLLAILVGLAIPPSGAENSRSARAECQPLLPQESVTASIGHDPSRDDGMAYGTTLDSSPDRDAANSDHERGLPPATGLDDHYKGPNGMARIVECIVTLLPFMWPSGIRRLQLRGAGLVLCILGASWLNVMILRQLRIIVDSSDAASAWVPLCVFILFVLGASESGLGLLKRWLWIPLRAFSTEALLTSAYSQILHLSADFHDSKSTPQMSHVLTSANAFSGLVETALLEALPALLDLMIAVVYLSISLESLQGLIIAVVGFAHFYLASHFIAKSAGPGRQMKEALYNEISIRHQGLAIWHDSDAIDQLGHEDNRHADAVAARQIADSSHERFWTASTAVRIAILISGFGASTMLAMWKEQSTLGEYMMLVAYWSRLHLTLLPVVYHGTHVGDGLMDAERFIQLMRTVPTIKNRGNARPLKFSKGDIEFDDVCFEYSPGTPIVKGFSLRIPAGQTVAFIESQNADTSVGRQCAGKSTLMKLLRRSYDVTKGSIRIDGQDIRDVHLHSLRQRISLVLPFPVLFDGTIMSNVRYGRITANDEEVYEACKAACIHQKIQSFPDGYDTQVGENGTKLSSSEIQLIGVARAILKGPESGILILDGATSALDGDTESRLQTSVSAFCKDLTKLIVTNRIATAMKADLVVVMADGQILEQGTPEHLFRSGSKHAAPLPMHGPVNSNGGSDDGPTDDLRANVGSTANDYVAVASSRLAEIVHQAQDVSDSKERSKLNPVAPTFTPRGTRIAVRTEYGSSSSEATNAESQPRLASSHTSCQWSDEVTAEEERLKSACKPELADQAPAAAPSLQQNNMVDVNSAGAPRTPCGQMRSKPSALEGPAPAVNDKPPEGREASDAVSSLKIMQFKRPRYSRRIQSKSEPSHDPVEVGPQLNQAIDEASEPDSSQDLDLPQQRRVSAPALKSALNKSKIARLARKSQKDVEPTEKKENESSSGVEPDSQISNTKRGEEVGQTPPLSGQIKSNEPAKVKNLGTVPQSQKGPPPLDNVPVAPASRGDHRGGHRGRGSRYQWRRRGARKPSSAVVASAPEPRP